MTAVSHTPVSCADAIRLRSGGQTQDRLAVCRKAIKGIICDTLWLPSWTRGQGGCKKYKSGIWKCCPFVPYSPTLNLNQTIPSSTREHSSVPFESLLSSLGGNIEHKRKLWAVTRRLLTKFGSNLSFHRQSIDSETSHTESHQPRLSPIQPLSTPHLHIITEPSTRSYKRYDLHFHSNFRQLLFTMPNWKTPEAFQRLLAAMVAANEMKVHYWTQNLTTVCLSVSLLPTLPASPHWYLSSLHPFILLLITRLATLWPMMRLQHLTRVLYEYSPYFEIMSLLEPKLVGSHNFRINAVDFAYVLFLYRC